MTASSAVAKSSDNQVAEPASGYIEETEKSSSASASAGLNLNIVGAIAGAFSSKETTAADGSKVREEQASGRGAGKGNLNAAGAAASEQKSRELKEV